MDIYHLAKMCHEYNKNFDTKSDLSNSRFEDYLKNSAPYRHIKQSLSSKNITLRTNDPSMYQSTDSDERRFELATLRIISGGIDLFHDPLSAGFFNPTAAGAASIIAPNIATQNASKYLLKQLDKQSLYLGGYCMRQLERVAKGEQPFSIPQFSEHKNAKIKMLVREVALLSKRLFIIKTDKAWRFPTQALLRIFDLVEVSVSEKTIQRHPCF
tara:strand:+ start:179 stop:817 length:639 start_codon:yes stop_codon:yes gene_type:complete